MPIIPQVLDNRDELIAIRRDIHAHPELAFAEQRTSDLVAGKLAEYGCEVYRGLAGTGVIGTIRRGNTPAAIGLRAPDPGDERFRLPLDPRRQDARLRP